MRIMRILSGYVLCGGRGCATEISFRVSPPLAGGACCRVIAKVPCRVRNRCGRGCRMTVCCKAQNRRRNSSKNSSRKTPFVGTVMYLCTVNENTSPRPRPSLPHPGRQAPRPSLLAMVRPHPASPERPIVRGTACRSRRNPLTNSMQGASQTVKKNVTL